MVDIGPRVNGTSLTSQLLPCTHGESGTVFCLDFRESQISRDGQPALTHCRSSLSRQRFEPPRSIGRGILPAASSRQMERSHRLNIRATALASIRRGWSDPTMFSSSVLMTLILKWCPVRGWLHMPLFHERLTQRPLRSVRGDGIFLAWWTWGEKGTSPRSIGSDWQEGTPTGPAGEPQVEDHRLPGHAWSRPARWLDGGDPPWSIG